MSSISDIKCGDIISYTHASQKEMYSSRLKRFRNGKVIHITDCFIETEHEGFNKLTAKKNIIDIVIEKKKPIPFIIESDSEEESDEESEDKQDECCGCEGKFYWRHLNYSSDDKGTLYCDDCMPESDDEEE
jgi:hypothetical protein